MKFAQRMTALMTSKEIRLMLRWMGVLFVFFLVLNTGKMFFAEGGVGWRSLKPLRWQYSAWLDLLAAFIIPLYTYSVYCLSCVLEAGKPTLVNPGIVVLGCITVPVMFAVTVLHGVCAGFCVAVGAVLATLLGFVILLCFVLGGIKLNRFVPEKWKRLVGGGLAWLGSKAIGDDLSNNSSRDE